MSRTSPNKALEAQIALLDDLSLKDLRECWLEITGQPAPKFFRRKFLLRAVAYRLQVKTHGGMSPSTKRQLREIALSLASGKEISLLLRTPIKPGTRLIRLWQEKTHIVTVLPDGFEWQGQKYNSLSAIAKAITGTNWNGYAFFGLKNGSKARASSTERTHAT